MYVKFKVFFYLNIIKSFQAMRPPIREGERVRRTVSFMPSTRERPVTVEIRTATLKRSKV